MSPMSNQDKEEDNLDEATTEVEINPGPQVEEFASHVDYCLIPNLSVTERKARVLELPRKFHDNARRRLHDKRHKRVLDSSGDVDMESEALSPSLTTQELKEAEQLDKEMQTWDLVRRLLPLRFAKSRTGAPRLSLSSSKHPALHDVIEADAILKERRTVLQWLQATASSGPDMDHLAHELQQSADRGDIIAHGWLHTRSKIKLRKRMTAWPHLLDRQTGGATASHINSDGVPLVTQLDPDAATRQGRKLEPQDDFFERSIWLGCFEHLRRGSSLETMREWCQERTQMWRAVSASGVILAADGKDCMVDAPPASLALWRRVCLSLSRNTDSGDYERAVYGISSGDIASVESVAKSWDDYMFASYNALVRARIDSFILGRCPIDVVSALSQSFSSFEPHQFHGDEAAIAKRLVASLESKESTRQEAMEPYKALQAALIADDLDAHLRTQGSLLTEGAAKMRPLGLFRQSPFSNTAECNRDKYFGAGQHEGLRVVAHIYLLFTVMRHLDASEGNTKPLESGFEMCGQEHVIAAYTEFLQLSGLEELIPLYCSILKPPVQYEVLGCNMIKQGNEEARYVQLKLMNRVGIEALQFVKAQAMRALDQLLSKSKVTYPPNPIQILADGRPTARQGRGIRPDFSVRSGEDMSAMDEHMIRALEWLLQVQAAWPDVVRIGVQAYKFFFTNRHLVAASRLVKRVGFSTIVSNIINEPEGFHDASLLEDHEFMREKLRQSGSPDALLEKVKVDLQDYHDLEALAETLDSLETIGSAMQLQSTEPPDNQKNIWSIVVHKGPSLKSNMEPLLNCWMEASIQAGDLELADIRQSYLPEVILAFVSALHFLGSGPSRDSLLEAMDLAAVVAERESDVAQVFVDSRRMAELMESFAAVSKALAVGAGEKRAAGSSSKKLREMGWSRDIWAVKK